MLLKFKVFLLTGCFLLIATAALADAPPFWKFHVGHTAKYNKEDSLGKKWVVTMEVVGTATPGGACTSGQYYQIKECNYDGDDAGCASPDIMYLGVTENEAYKCVGGAEYKFFQKGEGGTTWDHAASGGGTRYYEVTGKWNHGDLYIIRSYTVDGGGITQPAVVDFFMRGFGMVKEVDLWADNAPTKSVRQGYSGKTLYANFTDGLYVYDYDGQSTWTRISSVPADMVAVGPLLYATWTGQGLYVWDGTIWTRISSVPTSMVASGSSLNATWTGQGLYSWNGSTWTRISSVPTKIVPGQ